MNHIVETLVRFVRAFLSQPKARYAHARVRPRDRKRKGIAAVEFALSIPIWVMLLLGSADGTYCLLVNEKVDRIAYTVTDIVTQYQIITIANLNDILTAASQLMSPIPFGANGVVIVSSVFQPPQGAPVIEWQYTGAGP